jgi:hypothetical protein
MPEISMCTLVVWVNHSSEECLNKPQLYAVGERIAEITLNVNTTGYSRRKDDGPCVRDAGANVLELGRRIGLCAKSIFGARNPSFVWLL